MTASASRPASGRVAGKNTRRGTSKAKRAADSSSAPDDRSARGQIGIQSVETGMRLLAALAELTTDSAPPMLKTLAAAARMAPAKAHRYMVSLMRSELVERDRMTGRYRLGPMARHIGLSALRNLDAVKVATTRLAQICDDLQETVALAIWAYHGPIIVAVEEVRRRPVTISTRVGEIMPLLASATGRVFLAWLPTSLTAELLENELQANRTQRRNDAIISLKQAERIIAETRETGLGRTIGGLNPTINALSAPVFDYRGSIVAAVSSLGPADTFQVNSDGALARQIRAAADGISAELGRRAPVAPPAASDATD